MSELQRVYAIPPELLDELNQWRTGKIVAQRIVQTCEADGKVIKAQLMTWFGDGASKVEDIK